MNGGQETLFTLPCVPIPCISHLKEEACCSDWVPFCVFVVILTANVQGGHVSLSCDLKNSLGSQSKWARRRTLRSIDSVALCYCLRKLL